MRVTSVRFAAVLTAVTLGLAACGERNAETAARNETVQTQESVEAVAADISEDARDVAATTRQEAREGAAAAGRGLEEAGDEIRQAAPDRAPQ